MRLAPVVALLDLLLPPRCAACGTFVGGVAALCGACAARLPAPRPRCRRCGRPVGAGAPSPPCPRCLDEAGPLDGVVAAWPWGGVPRDLVLALKLRHVRAALGPLAGALAAAVRAAGVPGDLLVHVPLGARRRRARGFDQAAWLARALAQSTGLELASGALRRRRETRPQATLHGAARRRGPRGAFRAERRRVAGRCVLLVDDVLTTGATAGAAARALRRAGARSVVVACACRA